MEVTDRIASLEQRVQMQEDEIQLLKSALADVVRRLNLSEEQHAMSSRRGPTKGSMQYLTPLFSKRVIRFSGISVLTLRLQQHTHTHWLPFSPFRLYSLSPDNPALTSC